MAPRAAAVAGLLMAAGCSGALRAGWGGGSGAPVPPPPLEPPPVVRAPVPADPQEPEPDPVPSDAAGVARLQQLAFVWQLVAAHHPAVASGRVAWDSAFVRAVTRVRAADTPDALAEAYARLLRAVGDPLTRVEQEGAPPPPPAPEGVAVTRDADSVLMVRLPPAPAYSADAEARVAEALRRGAARVVLDVRGGTGETPDAWSEAFTQFVARTGVASALAWRPTRLPVERQRVVGGARTVDGVAAPEDGWAHPDGALLPAAGGTPRRVVLVANTASVVPPALLALVGSRQAVLVAEEGVRDDRQVQSEVVPVGLGVAVRVRLGELWHGDGSTGIPVDTVVPRGGAGVPADSAPALRTALAWVRREGPWPARPVPPVSAAAALPRYYDAEPYPFMGARVLAGARVWAALRTRHAHRDQMDEDVDEGWVRAIPLLEGARNATEYAAALRGMVAAFDDGQVTLTGGVADSLAGGAWAPFRVEAVEGVPLVTAVVRDEAVRALGIVEGQEVTAADGFPLPAWLTEHRRDLSAPNPWVREERLLRRLPEGPPGRALFRLREASGRERQLDVPRRVAHRAQLPRMERPLQPAVRMPAAGITYVDVERLPLDSVRALLAGARGGRGVVLDLRGFLPEPVAGAALDAVVAAVAPPSARRGVVAREVVRWQRRPCLAAAWREASQQCAELREVRPLEVVLPAVVDGAGAPGAGAPAPRVVALIDARTQGAMERLAMRLEVLAGATFVGSPSAGSPSEVMPVALPGGLTVTVPLAEWRRPDGAAVQRVGIPPQVVAERTVRGVRVGRDEVLERALQWLQQALDGPPGRRRE